jgi:hypothetical protein
VTRQLDELRASGDDINQFLETLVQKAKKTLPNRDLTPKDLRVEKGRRAIYGQTQRGFRQDLSREDIETLDKLISQPALNSSQAQPSRLVPNYQISVGDEVLFRQERDGTVSVNRMQLENQQNLAPESQKEAKTFLEQTKEAFSAEYDPDPPYAEEDFVAIQIDPKTSLFQDEVGKFSSNPSSLQQKIQQTYKYAGKPQELNAEVTTLINAWLSASIGKKDEIERLLPEEKNQLEKLSQKNYGISFQQLLSRPRMPTTDEAWAQRQQAQARDNQSSAKNLQPELESNSQQEVSRPFINIDAAKEALLHSNPNIWVRAGVKAFSASKQETIQDADKDDIDDGNDSDPTNGDLPQSQAQDLSIESQSESESVSIIEPNEIPEAVRVAERDVEKLPDGKGKQLFGTLVENIAQKAKEIGYQTINAISNLLTWKQNQDVANTALKLFNQNYEKTGETRYEAVGYNVTLKGLNNYEITDKEGNSLMKFQKKPLGVKVNRCEMEARDYKQFNRAKQSLDRNPDTMERDSQSRLARLQYLAPQRDREIVAAMYAKDTADTAERFLNHMGVDKWNAGVKGNYNIERQGNDLKIESKADGRGVVFERKNGEIIDRLSSKDFKHFRDLDRLLNKRLQEIVSKPTNNLRERPPQPKVKREKELSL